MKIERLAREKKLKPLSRKQRRQTKGRPHPWVLWNKVLVCHYSKCNLPPSSCPVLMCRKLRQRLLTSETLERLHAEEEEREKQRAIEEAEDGVVREPDPTEKIGRFSLPLYAVESVEREITHIYSDLFQVPEKAEGEDGDVEDDADWVSDSTLITIEDSVSAPSALKVYLLDNPIVTADLSVRPTYQSLMEQRDRACQGLFHRDQTLVDTFLGLVPVASTAAGGPQPKKKTARLAAAELAALHAFDPKAPGVAPVEVPIEWLETNLDPAVVDQLLGARGVDSEGKKVSVTWDRLRRDNFDGGVDLFAWIIHRFKVPRLLEDPEPWQEKPPAADFEPVAMEEEDPTIGSAGQPPSGAESGTAPAETGEAPSLPVGEEAVHAPNGGSKDGAAAAPEVPLETSQDATGFVIPAADPSAQSSTISEKENAPLRLFQRQIAFDRSHGFVSRRLGGVPLLVRLLLPPPDAPTNLGIAVRAYDPATCLTSTLFLDLEALSHALAPEVYSEGVVKLDYHESGMDLELNLPALARYILGHTRDVIGARKDGHRVVLYLVKDEEERRRNEELRLQEAWRRQHVSGH